MEVRSYNCELGIANLLFKRVFQNIRIERTDSVGKKNLITVNCQFGQRSRIFKNWQNAEKRATIKLPMIVINRTGYQRDPQRLNNLHNEVKYEVTSKNRIYDYLTPVPVSISYDVTVMSKYPSDIDQIASNFMVFFNSSIYVSCVHPKYDGIKMNNQVVMEDSVSEEHPDELDGNSDDFITSTFSFTFKTFLFAGMKQAKKIHSQILSTYTSSFISTDIIEISPDEIDNFQKDHPGSCVSATISNNVTADITSYIDNPEISDQVYDEFAPIIKRIDIGFYPTPIMSSFRAYQKEVDETYADVISIASGYISSTSYTSSYYVDGRLSSITPNDLIIEPTDTYESIAPYKDRLIWKIDEASTEEFPDNVRPYRKFQMS